jgi:hypothetical protein
MVKVRMNRHKTKTKGDIGVTKVIADLTEKGYSVCLPISEHQPYDLIFENELGELKKVQVKYRENGTFTNNTVHVGSDGKQVKKTYKITDFNYYAIYLPNIKECVYIPNNNNICIKIATELPNSYTPYNWWEDYRHPNRTELAPTRSIKDIPGFTPLITLKGENKEMRRKVKNRPTKEELQTLIDTTPYVKIGEMYGVSDNAIRKWAKSYGILRNKLKRNRLTIPDHPANLN